jgi:hypothetical protein
VVTQLLHTNTKNHNLEKEAIATWRSDLKRVLGVFEVRSVASSWPSLTLHVQTELEIDKLVPVSNTRQDVPDSRTSASNIHHDTSKAHHESNSGPPVSGVQNYGSNTRTITPGVRSNTLRHREDHDGQSRAVNVTHTPIAIL